MIVGWQTGRGNAARRSGQLAELRRRLVAAENALTDALAAADVPVRCGVNREGSR
jgi:hypothetical protein